MDKDRILIVRCGEVALKGMNKPYFERMLTERIGKRLKASGFSADVKRHEGLIFVRYNHEINTDAIAGEISKVFGVASISPAVEAKSDMDDIGRVAVDFMNTLIAERGVKTFKV